MKSQSVTAAVTLRKQFQDKIFLIWKSFHFVENFYFLLIGNEIRATVETNQRPTEFPIKMQLPPTMFHLSPMRWDTSMVRHFRWLLKTTFPSPAFYFRDILFVVFTLLSFPLSAVSVMTCDLQVNQSQLRYSTRQEVRIWRSGGENLIYSFPLKKSVCNNNFILHCIRFVCIYCL